MKCTVNCLFGLAVTLTAATLWAKEPAAATAEKPAAESTAPPSLDGVTWNAQSVSLADLRGKTVVLLVYATNYRVAEDWPTVFLAQLKAVTQKKPVIILAISVDKKADAGMAYMNERHFNAPNIIHGRDALMPGRLGLKTEYFQYLVIDPSGQVVARGDAGTHATVNGEVRFKLPWDLWNSKDLGEFEVLDGGMSDAVRKILWPYEWGALLSDGEVKRAMTDLPADDQKAISQALDRFLATQIKKLQEGVDGTAEERLATFERAKRLYNAFKSREQAADIKEIGVQLNQDAAFKREMAAKQAYDKAVQQAQAAKNGAQMRHRLMQTVATQYKNTYYGDLAAGDGKTERPESIHRWKDFTEAEIQAALVKQKAFFAEVSSKIPSAGMKSYETKRFLFYSDIPAEIINKVYLPNLDAMYTQLCGAYGMETTRNIWLGKAIIVAFARESSFEQFEQVFYHNRVPGAQGIAHNDRTKRVVISCYAGDDPKYFAVVLVHETAHGFSWCYKAAEAVPNWLNEGASEWIAHRVVTGDTSIPKKIQVAMRHMQQSRSLGGDFFTADHIASWQYGAAASITDFLLTYEPNGRPAATSWKSKGKTSRYRKLMDGIKTGLPWEDALKEAYNLTPAKLVQVYGQSIGIPNLQP